MKNQFIILFFVFSAVCNKGDAQTNLDSQLRYFPIKQFLGKPIDSLLAKIPSGYDTLFSIAGSSTINKAATLQVNYPPENQFWILISITDPHYIKLTKSIDTPPEIAWPIHLLRKEKIGSILIGRGGYEYLQEAYIE